jgi:hypothetical protein
MSVQSNNEQTGHYDIKFDQHDYFHTVAMRHVGSWTSAVRMKKLRISRGFSISGFCQSVFSQSPLTADEAVDCRAMKLLTCLRVPVRSSTGGCGAKCR